MKHELRKRLSNSIPADEKRKTENSGAGTIRNIRVGSLLFVAVMIVVSGSCSGGTWEPGPVDHFSVRIERIQVLDRTGAWVVRDIGSLAEDEIAYATPTKVDVTIQVVPENRGFDGFVQIQMVPGNVLAVTSDNAEVLRTNIRVRAGTPTLAQVELDGAYGASRVWVEDVGLDPAPLTGAACDDGLDNDGDGFFDYPQDPGCFLRNDGTEQEGTHAVGVSDPVHFLNPRLAHVNGCDLIPDLERQSVLVDIGELWVTAVTPNGFYVSDKSFMEGACDEATGCCDGGRFSHIFAYNFNTPYNLRICDRLSFVSGIVGDFYGFTELNFPSWELADIDPNTPGHQILRDAPADITPEECPLPSTEITAEMLIRRRYMESLESALVYVNNPVLPSYFVDCDFNGNGEVGYSAATDETVPPEQVVDQQVFDLEFCNRQSSRCSEMACNDGCVALEEGCAELTTYREYGQYPVRVNGVPVLLVTGTNVPQFNPVVRARAGTRNVTRIMGVLKEFAPLDSPWIIEPRCRQDIYIQGDDLFQEVALHRRCVPSEETGDYEDPY